MFEESTTARGRIADCSSGLLEGSLEKNGDCIVANTYNRRSTACRRHKELDGKANPFSRLISLDSHNHPLSLNPSVNNSLFDCALLLLQPSTNCSSMTAPSYVNAAAFGPTPKEASTYPNTSGRDSQLEELSRPPPTSMTLTATLQLLAPLDTKTDIFLMTRSYVQNWLIWAYHQKIQKGEAGRVEAAVRLAADKLGLTPPSLDMEHTDPGPVDSSILSLEGHPLLLRPNVVVVDGTVEATSAAWEAADSPLRRVKSLPVELKRETKEDDPNTYSFDENDGHPKCCAVPEQFYEVCRV
jgi:hypothetical protein